MAPSGKAALAKRQKDRADLKSRDIIWVGIAASESNIQRIAAMLMFSEWPIEVEPQEDQLANVLPWGEETPPEIEFNYEAIRADITRALTAILEKDESQKPRLKALIQEHGGERLSLVPEKNLPELFASINRIREEIV
jgi:hypothetical protein